MEAALADHIEQRTGALDLSGDAARDDEQLGCSRRLRPTEHRSRNIGLPLVGMACGDGVGCGHRDGAHGDMQRAGRQAGDQTVFAGQDRVQRSVVGQHRQDDVPSSGGLRGGGRPTGASLDEFGRLRRRTIPNHQVVARLQKVGGDGRTHVSEANEGDIHPTASFSTQTDPRPDVGGRSVSKSFRPSRPAHSDRTAPKEQGSNRRGSARPTGRRETEATPPEPARGYGRRSCAPRPSA